TGDKDPFALRRATLGALRIMKEHALPLPLRNLLQVAVTNLGERLSETDTVSQVYDFMLERLKGIYLEQGVSANVFEAVARVQPDSVVDFDRRISGVITFERQAEAEALAAANKRIRNILRKAGERPPENTDPSLFEGNEEQLLHQLVEQKTQQIEPMLAVFDYEAVLLSLAELRQPVDHFFDEVMVMVGDPALRANRLALLNQLSQLFLKVADISRI
ncbi:MAG: glycine--tRNA ligase subunit beta, partial [Chloroflexi bacterium]